MCQISIRCYAELNDFLPRECRFITFPLSLAEGGSIETLLEKVNIPPETVDLILVNGSAVSMEYKPTEGDRISLYPVFECFDISSVTKSRISPLRRPKFILDVHLGKLAHYLRMFGFDTLCENNYTNDLLLDLSYKEHRILLSRNMSLIDHETLTHAHLIKEEKPYNQLIEIFELLDLYNLSAPFTRCIECNSLLRHIDKQSILAKIPPSVISWCNEYQICSKCDRIYWKGSHYEHMNKFVQEILKRKQIHL